MARFEKSDAVDGSVKIRPLIQGDIFSVAKIAKSSMLFPWPEKVFRDCLKDDYHGWVAEINDKIIGFIIILLQQQECQLMNIAINPHYRCKGFAKQLLQHAIQFAKTSRAKCMLLEVRASNKAAIEFYKKFGGVKMSVRKNYYPAENGREDALVFVLNL